MDNEKYLGQTLKIKIDRPYGSKHQSMVSSIQLIMDMFQIPLVVTEKN